jgi:Protein of unknown function (DUF1822)
MSTLDRSIQPPINQPQPGEIWELSGDLTKIVQTHQLAASSCLARYVTIVREPQSTNPDICSAMLLSTETTYLSGVDVLIPSVCSGLDRDILAETWNVGNLSIDILERRVGKRLSRSIYDLLLSIGDADAGQSIEIPSIAAIRALGLDIAPEIVEDDAFHQRERVWLQRFDPISTARTAKLVQLAAAIERESCDLTKIRTNLSHWLQQIVAPQWQDTHHFERRMAIATRREIADDEITETIALLQASEDEVQRCQLIKRLGSIAGGREDALAAMVELVQTAEDDETLWTAVGSLRKLNPQHPSIGMRKLQSIDLGIKIDFVVSIVPKISDRFSVFLQVYSACVEEYLPPKLKLILQDDLGNSLIEIVSRSHDNGIQLKISGVAGELFSVCLELDGVRSIVDFVI